MVQNISRKFASFPEGAIATFDKNQFELYYPARFASEIEDALAETDSQKKRTAKQDLLKTVLQWTAADIEASRSEWAESAAHVIDFLKQVDVTLKEA